MPTAFTGSLNTNKIMGAIYNMIISQQVFADNIAGVNSQLVDSARVDGGLYGDTKLYYATDVLCSNAWGNDAEATNLLALERPDSPSCQKITIDSFRQIRLTVDNYLSKQAWSHEGAFSEFNSIMLGWIGETKKIYDACNYNVFFGTTESATGKQTQSVSLASGATAVADIEAQNRLNAQKIAQKVADILVDLKDISRDYNDYGYLRSYSGEAIKVVWSAQVMNEITKLDLPQMFHNEGIIDKFSQEALPKRFFGRAVNTSTDVGSGKVINASNVYDNTKGTLRSKIEFTVTDSSKATGRAPGYRKHYFPGDEIPNGSTVKASGASTGEFNYADVYVEDSTILCKIVVKMPPYMSAFEVSTNFFNPRSLTDTHFTTFGHNTLDYLANYPFITLKKA